MRAPYAPVRFEYRIWGAAFPELPAPDQVPASPEVYLLPTGVDDVNAKFRAGALEIKRLLGMRAGLQQWLPALRCPLPLPAAVIEHELCPALGVVAPPLKRARYDLERFLARSRAPGRACRPCVWSSGGACSRSRAPGRSAPGSSSARSPSRASRSRPRCSRPHSRAVGELGLARAPNLDYIAALRRRLAGLALGADLSPAD